MKAKLDYTEAEIIHLIGRYHSLANMVTEFHKHPHPFVAIGESEREFFGVQKIIESIAKEYERRGIERDEAIELLKLYVERFFSLDAAKKLIAEAERR